MGWRRFPVLWVALLLGGAEGRVLNASCAAPETAVLQPAPPQHVESRLRPPTVRLFLLPFSAPVSWYRDEPTALSQFVFSQLLVQRVPRSAQRVSAACQRVQLIEGVLFAGGAGGGGGMRHAGATGGGK